MKITPAPVAPAEPMPKIHYYAFLIMAAVMTIFAFLMITQASEEAPAFNCHVSGNGQCGPGVAWHGFVNIDGEA